MIDPGLIAPLQTVRDYFASIGDLTMSARLEAIISANEAGTEDEVHARLVPLFDGKEKSLSEFGCSDRKVSDFVDELFFSSLMLGRKLAENARLGGAPGM
jgi:hypothetical protein